MPKVTSNHVPVYPMRIQARRGSAVEKRYYSNSRLPGIAWPSPAAISAGINPAPLEDLIFHGGKTVAHMGFKNLYVGLQSDWIASNVDFIDKAITRAMQDRRLNNVMAQYFPGSLLSCEPLPSMVLGNTKPAHLDEPDIEQQVIGLFKGGQLGKTGFDSTLFNFILPPGVILKLGPDTSSDGLGGYHGSVHTKDTSGHPLTLYYSASVFSQILADGTQNGIVAFNAPWKNVVATLYHELNEFRTDADVNDAIRMQSNDPLGWMSRQGHECGDQPIFAAGASLESVFREISPSDGGKALPVQFLYSNVVHGAEGPVETPDAWHASVKSSGLATRSMPSLAPQSQALMPAAVVIDRVIQAHLVELTKPGVLSVRPGYQASGGWLTQKPAIVVTVLNKSDDLASTDRLPETLAGFAVDVRQAGPLQRLRATNPALYAAVAERAPDELKLAEFALERDVTGQPTSSAELESARTPVKLPLTYTPPPDAPLDPIDDEFTIVCHASPDAGWLQLQPFLAGTHSRLTVGMYDFTSAHILATFKSTFGKSGRLQLVLDHPAPDRSSDQTDDDTQAALASTLDDRLQFAWALEAHDPHAAAAIFPSAYHIKVAVRDGTDFWLSSGNWNNSNQPDINPFTNPSSATAVLKKSDRDWHVIVTHRKLSGLFETYLRNDLNVAAQHQAPIGAANAAVADALTTLAIPDQAVTSRIPQQFFEPKVITARMTIQPVLTPDNYPATILTLIHSAQSSLYMQIPYITPNANPESAMLDGLIAAIADRLRHGVDVRLILSSFAKLPNLEQLQAAGIDSSVIRIQNNLHNKGIIVDSKIVLIGSQNWSPPGVTTNRDASLIIQNAEAALYWQTIFLHDWTHMAAQRAGD